MGSVVVYVVEQHDEVPVCAARIRAAASQAGCVGIDTETALTRGSQDPARTPPPAAGVSLLQISAGSECFLFRSAVLQSPAGGFPRCLADILESDTVVKIGVGLDSDTARLGGMGVTCRRMLDLQSVACLRGVPTGLKSLVERYVSPREAADLFGQDPFDSLWQAPHKKKPSAVHYTWDMDTLPLSSVQYAAADVLALPLLASRLIEGFAAVRAESAPAPLAEELPDVFSWLRAYAFSEPGKGREFGPLINQMCNSYGTWRNIMCEQDRKTRARECIRALIKDGRLAEVGDSKKTLVLA